MKAHGLEWAEVTSTDFPMWDQVYPFRLNGWTAFRHPKRPIAMLVRGDARRFMVRGQIYDTYSSALRVA